MFSLEKVILFALCAATFGTTNGAFVSDKRWETPCRVGSSADTITVPVPTTSPHAGINIETLETLLDATDDAMAMVEAFKAKYLPRFENPHAAMWLGMMNYAHMPPLTMTETQIEASVDDVTNTYLQTYEKLSVIAVFLERVVYDEKEHDDGEFSTELENLQRKVYDMLCNIHNLINRTGSQITNHVTTDAMPASDRHLPRSERYFRDYLIVKDSGILYSTLNRLFDEIKIHLKAQTK